MRARAADLGFALDEAQEGAVRQLQRLFDEVQAVEKGDGGFIRFLTRRRAVRGLYLYGGVGRGKSFLMDSFFAAAPIERRRRIHFHRFMQEVHHGLHERQGRAEPLAAIARDLAAQTRLLCLDEFHITDITDAMLMRRLLEALFAEGVVLCTTSNFHPDALYEHGLQRNQFLPAIELIKQSLDVVNVDNGTDYRLRELEQAGIYHLISEGDEPMHRAFMQIARHESPDSGSLDIEERMIRVRLHARGVAWFDFNELCDGPRGKADYIELARRYHTILISHVPCFTGQDADRLRRFVWLVDEFYDRRVKLILSADAGLQDLMPEDDGSDPFQAQLNASLKDRLLSRLTEMQSRDYLSQPHIP